MNPNITDLFPEITSANFSPNQLERQARCIQGETVVANLHRDKPLIKWAQENGCYQYIGRDKAQNPFGNSFILGTHGDRNVVCDLFAKSQLPSIRHLIPSLKGKVLGCYCYPLRCHGDTLAQEANKTAP